VSAWSSSVVASFESGYMMSSSLSTKVLNLLCRNRDLDRVIGRSGTNGTFSGP
ncbi:unnamed protein product, partial [Arabidopsis halleri]